MNLDDVPADAVMILTQELDRLFKFANCNPRCHACQKQIDIGQQFQLVSFRGMDRMTCGTCDRSGLERARQKYLANLPGRGGYSRASRRALQSFQSCA